MSIVLNDNVEIRAGKPNDRWYLNPNTNSIWADIATVNATIPIGYRSRRLVVQLPDGDYWYEAGVADVDLIKKITTASSKKYHTDSTTKMTILASEATSSDDYSLFYDLEITVADRGKYFDLNVASVGNLEYGDGLAYNIILPLIADCDDAFCFKVHFNTRGGNTSEVPLADVTAQNTSTTNKYMSSGKTYTWTLSKANNEWFVDEEESLSSPQVTYLPTYIGEGGDHLLSNTNHTYLFDAGYSGNSTGSAIKDFVLLPVAWCLDKWEELVLVTDLPDDPTKCPKFYVFDSLNETIVGEGTSWGFPTGSKAGSKITFKAIKGNKWFIKDQMILI